MDMSRVGPGVWIAGIGGLVLLVALFFLDWYGIGEPEIAPIEISASLFAQVEPPPEIPGIELEVPEEEFGAWEGQGFLGTIANLVMVAAGVWAIVAVGLRSGLAELRTDVGTVTAALGIAAAVMVLLRIIFPVGEIEGFEFDSELKVGIFIALIGAVLIAVGGVMSRGEAPVGPAAPARPEPPAPPPPGEPPPPPPSQPPPG
jgi:hypothetical protein